MIDFLETKYLDKLIELPAFIETSHKKDFKLSDFINSDNNRNMNEVGLMDYSFIQKGQAASKGIAHKPSKTNMIYSFWLMIALELKEFGFIKSKLHKVKNYLFQEFDILENLNIPIDKESLLKQLEQFDYEDKGLGKLIKKELTEKIKSGAFINAIRDQRVSRLFLIILKMISTGKDLHLYIDGKGETLLIDENELTDIELDDLAFDSKVTLPLKKYLLYFIGVYVEIDFLLATKILTPKKRAILKVLRDNEIENLSVKYYKEKARSYKNEQYNKVDMLLRLSDALLKGGFEEITIKTDSETVYYSELEAQMTT